MVTSAPGLLRSVPQGKPPRNPISLKQVESVISRSVAVFGIVFGAQTVPVLLSQAGQAQPVWLIVTVSTVFASLILAFICSVTERFVRLSHGVVAIVYVLVLVSWPFAVIDPAAVTTQNHWLYLLLTVGTATAAISFSTRVAVIYLCAVPAIYGLIRLLPAGGSVSFWQDVFDVLYAMILGGTIIIIARMLRQAAASVDNAQATALARYGHAVRQHATEVERVQVDAIVHDSVLTTLLTAARAYTPEAMALSATNAGNAIEHLHAAALVVPDDGTTVRLRDVAVRIHDAAHGLTPPFDVRMRDIGPRSMPIQAAEAAYSAAMQAMVNSIQHAGADPTIQRWLSVFGVGIDGIQIEVGDNGTGFDLGQVPQERLGVRVSIMERVANAGGLATIDSGAGQGTVVTIRWPLVPTSNASASNGLPRSTGGVGIPTSEPAHSTPDSAHPQSGGTA